MKRHLYWLRAWRALRATAAVCASIGSSSAAELIITDPSGQALATVMVTQTLAQPNPADTSDGGYQQPGQAHHTDTERTAFTDHRGRAQLPQRTGSMLYRLRKPGFRDQLVNAAAGQTVLKATLQPETDPFKLAEAKPASSWLGALNLGSVDTKRHFQMQCGFCHQQGNAFTRRERSPEDWHTTINRMVRYGSRLPSELQQSLPEKLSAGYRQLRENPALVRGGIHWDGALSKVAITEWPIGDAMSQTHDMLIARNRLVYVADNIQDRLYEIDPATDAVTVYKIPHKAGDQPGGLIAGRLKDFPRHDSTSNAHSLAESPRDGHIFITPSAQRRLVEFDPKSKAFTLHEIGAGFYPHTIRTDAQDRVWFTLALSNQVARFDRATRKFTLYDLPSRGFKEKMIGRSMGFLYQLMNWGLPLSNWLPIDWVSTGLPLVYGIDVTPDGMVWFARLHTQEIGSIDPASGKITMIPTPFLGPRRLRADADGNLWIVAFGESKIARYEPKSGKFSMFDIPVEPKGSETPYALNVDKKRGIVWVNGNQSDALYGFDIKTESWRTIPLPRRTTFTRDIEIDDDGSLYTANSNFPSWHIEGAQPTLIRVQSK
jgi:virginiamycin B lyase